MTLAHVVSVSGGKDSTALYLRAMERGLPFRAVFADTGNEHEWTYDFVRELPGRTGGPEIQWVKADFSARLAKKRKFVARVWPIKGVPMDKVEKALALLHPTGNPFLDLCLLKTRFPSARARFCTDDTKLVPIFEQVYRPIVDTGTTLISWQGVRHEESLARADLPRLQRINPVPFSMPAALRALGENWKTYAYRPLIEWTVDDVFAYHRKHGIAHNPLYDAGMGRVGCMPCIMCRKDEMRAIADRFPDHIDRIADWEALVSDVSKRGNSTFFNIQDDPLLSNGWDKDDYDWSLENTGIRARVEWSRTSRGGAAI
ncbi:phosphoadenosine phosphosulfate reductase family protein [Agrobacterium tumefaciens]|uniref:phosphoadenosine phosphosulfate reductase domain-containing protein n=1 Tax=Agrobacterium tumefaciens TaxID=358 RepID=UPI0015717148|nr:phosphoadenosine phosphosulfate reductase family protein [Agrobacterium tumefaciens]NSX92670.1 phosphoadenosine phosphosulfate reductase family protein [Agrobacterium tumefaciens]NSX92731.1 phosphoadenosine phosphosulfate reductase family protein [Agrobacterium tumefaciens]